MNGSGTRSWSCTYEPNTDWRCTTARPAARYTARSARSHLRTYGWSIHIAASTPATASVNAPSVRTAAGTLPVALRRWVSTVLTARQPRRARLLDIVSDTWGT